MTTELRAFNAQGEQLFFVPDTDARQFLEFDTVGAAFDRMESTRSAYRWIADDSRFVRNRIASFRMDHEEWPRDAVAEHAQVRAARRAKAPQAPQEAQEAQEATSAPADSAYCVQCHKDTLPVSWLCDREPVTDNGTDRDADIVSRFEGRCLKCCTHNHG